MQRECAGADGIRCPWGARARAGSHLCVGCSAIVGRAHATGARLHAVVAPGAPVPVAVEAIDARSAGPGPLALSVPGSAGVRLVHRALREHIAALEARTRELMMQIAAAEGEGAGDDDEMQLRQAARRAQMALNAADLAELRTLDAATGLLPWE